MLIHGGPRDSSLVGSNGDDVLFEPTGNDWIGGAFGNDSISAGEGNGHVFGEEGNDYLYGDNGPETARGRSGQRQALRRSRHDVLFASDGRDHLTGGEGQDTFVFQSHSPVPGIDPTRWPNPGYTNILDFDPTHGTFAFDAVGYYSDGTGANFVSHACSHSGHPVDAFHSGAASDANGEHVVVVTDKSFYSGDGAANAIAGETAGDIIVYHDDLTKSAVLAHVTSENHGKCPRTYLV